MQLNSQDIVKQLIEEYKPFTEQESRDKEAMLSFLNTFDNTLLRDNLHGHFTATAFVVNDYCTDALMLHHKIMNDWICPGGHADGESDLYSVALREIEEETGLKAEPMFDKEVFSIQAAPVKGHIKNGQYVPAHVHYDVLFVFKVKNEDMNKIRVLPSENTAVEWWPIGRVLEDPRVVDWAQPIFKKIIKKMDI